VILLVIDVQVGLDDPQYGERNNPECEDRIAELLGAWRRSPYPVIYTRHLSVRPGSPLAERNPGSRIKASVAPRDGELVFTKATNSAFKNQHFRAAITASGMREVVLTGTATDACVAATAREAKDLGYQVTLIADASATYPRTGPDGTRYSGEIVHQVSLAALGAEMRVCTSAAMIGELQTILAGDGPAIA
jgi:nicotinamidase-related amidase